LNLAKKRKGKERKGTERKEEKQVRKGEDAAVLYKRREEKGLQQDCPSTSLAPSIFLVAFLYVI